MNHNLGAVVVGSLLMVGLVSLVKVMPLQIVSAIAAPIAPQPQSIQPKSPMVSQNMTVSPKFSNANTRFGFKLFSAVAKQDTGKNVFISPSSVAIALAMAYNGANGETQNAMARAMELQGMSLQELNQANATLKTLLENPDPAVQLAIANSLWTRQGISFKPEFLQRNRQFYQAKVSELDFGNPRSVATINTWVSQNTRGKIDSIIDSIDPNDVMFLINAIYFKGNWSRKFDPQNTALQPFHLLNNQPKNHPMMAQNGEYRYYETSQFQAVRLPYGTKQRVSFYVFLPQSSSSLTEFQKNLTAENWEQWMAKFRQRQGSIQIPRFKLEYDVQLKNVLSQLGMAEAFSSRANFSGLSSVPTKIDQVKHKTFVEVNEEGTEAAAVTSIGIRATSARPMEEPFRMVVDRPFFCAIQDDQTGTILFMGALSNPNI
ncbi:serpin family protein [Leptolyngbyaceae cyanobacterium UHCC 1019]